MRETCNEREYGTPECSGFTVLLLSAMLRKGILVYFWNDGSVHVLKGSLMAVWSILLLGGFQYLVQSSSKYLQE